MSFGSVAGAVIGVGLSYALSDDNGAQGANDASAQATRQTAAIAQDQWNYYKSHYQPLESGLIDQATKAGSPEEFAAARGRAGADVEGAFNQAQKTTQSRMQSYGINPGSPAYQSTAASLDLAKGSAKAGALTAADNNQRALAYSKALDVVGLGRNIPAQSAASSANAANSANASSQTQFFQNQQNMKNIGYGLQPVVSKLSDAAGNWFNSGSTGPASNQVSSGWTPAQTQAYDGTGESGGFDFAYKEGGPVTRFQSGGLVDVKSVLKSRGFSDDAAKKVITPHMKGLKPRGYADGGDVGRQGLGDDQSNMGVTIDNETGQVIGPGSGTSDSVPAQIDGQQPAALSSGEFVMNAEVPKLSGDEILEAINQAGLKKRQMGLEPRAQQTSNDVSGDAGMTAYAKGGKVEDKNWKRGEFIVGRYYDHEAEGIPGVPQYSGSTITYGENYDNALESERQDGDDDLKARAQRLNAAPKKRMANGGPVTRSYSRSGLGA